MSFDTPLIAAVTLQRQRLSDADTTSDDATFQLQLAHVLLEGGYDGVATMAEALQGGDHGLGALDRLDGEVVVVDGEPWQIDFRGVAHLIPPEATTPFMVVSHLHSPHTRTLRDCSLEQVAAVVEELVHDPGAVVAIRLEGTFTRVLVRSVRAQSPPYRPFAEVCLTDEVRWVMTPFEGVFVGFRFPDLAEGSTIAGLHLHALAADRSTGGHNYELHVQEAVLSVGVSHEVVIALPDRGMVDLLETPRAMRAVQRQLLRHGPRSTPDIAASLEITVGEALRRLDWLADRGHVEAITARVGGQGGDLRWRARLNSHSGRVQSSVSERLADF